MTLRHAQNSMALFNLGAHMLGNTRLTLDELSLAVNTRCKYRLADRHPEIQHVQDYLRDRGNDAGRAGRTDDYYGFVLTVDDSRCHACCAPLAWLDRVGVPGDGVEVDHGVVVHETQAGRDDAGG